MLHPLRSEVDLTSESPAREADSNMGRGQQMRRLSGLLTRAASQRTQVAGISSSAGSGKPAGVVSNAANAAAQAGKEQQQALAPASQRSLASVAQTSTTSSATKLQLHKVTAVKTDLYGAISAISEGSIVEEGVYKNVDGHR